MAKMTARDVIRAAMRAGVALTVDGESVRLTPLSKAPDWLPDAVREHKVEILRELRKPIIKRPPALQAPSPDGPPTGRNVFERFGMPGGW